MVLLCVLSYDFKQSSKPKIKLKEFVNQHREVFQTDAD